MENMKLQLAEYAFHANPSKVEVHDQAVQTIEVESNSSPTSTVSTKAPMNVEILDPEYLGQYHLMFNGLNKIPYVSWRALEWILKDYGLIRYEWESKYVDKSLQEKGRDPLLAWTIEPPPAVLIDLYFCPCERHYKWAPNSTIANVEYNWLRIVRSFQSYQDCYNTYN